MKILFNTIISEVSEKKNQESNGLHVFQHNTPIIRMKRMISGAGIFFEASNATVVAITATLSKVSPLDCIRISAATAIMPSATAVMLEFS